VIFLILVTIPPLVLQRVRDPFESLAATYVLAGNPRMDQLPPGTLIDERFRLEGCQAAGGMGAIFTALDLASGQKVALKTTRWASPELEARFAREARVLAQLRHEHIVRYVAHGRTPEGHAYLAMDWLEGELLSERLRRGPLSVEQSLAVTLRIADALSVAHALGIVHRDLKPNNLMCVGRDLERVTVLDFGLALADATMLITRTGEFAGTPGYMAPEQVRGLHEVDARADVFSLGCVLFECLTGRPAFSGDHVYAVLAKILVEEEPRVSELLPSVPEVVDDLVSRMLSREAGRRPRDGRALIGELEAIRETSSLRPGAVRGGLGHQERRVLCVILASEQREGRADGDAARAASLKEETAILEAAVKSFGGEMERFTVLGDLVVTFRGAASATDLAARAARCALAIAGLLPKKQVALATVRGVVQRRLLGAAIDEAASLIARAASEHETLLHVRSGDLLREPAPRLPVQLDDLTAGLLDSHFEVGVGQRGGALLLDYMEHADPARTLLGEPTPFLGRERELGKIAGAYAECVSEPRAQAIVLSGPPGIGKSRLRSEFLGRLAQHAASAPQVWIGSADPMASGAAFSLLTNMLRREADIRPGEDVARCRQKLEARLGQRLSRDARSRVTAFLGEMCGIRLGDGKRPELRAARADAEAMGDQLLLAWLALLDAESGAGPLVLVLEDVQWGDAASLRFVEAALRQLAQRPLLVLATARPDVREVFPGLWARVPHEHLELGPLSAIAARKLVQRTLASELAEQHGARIVQQAGGNALYLEELIRAAAVHQDQPRTVLAMIAARLEALPGPQRRVLRAASILGASFSVGALCPLIGREALDIAATLGELSHEEWLVCQPGATQQQHLEYAFRHVLLRDAAYDMLTDEDRQLGHRLAGQWLAEREGEAHALHVAEHLERGGEPGRAAHWYGAAAKRALDGTELRRAIALSQKGLDCAARGGETASDEKLGELRGVLAEAYNWTGANAEAEADGSAALHLLRVGEPSWYAAASQLALAAGRLGHVPRVVELAQQLHGLPVDDGTVAPWLRAAAPTAERLAFAGRGDLAEQLLARMEERVEAASLADPTARARLAVGRAIHEALRGNPGSALVHLTLAADVFARFGLHRKSAVQRHVLAYTCVLLGAHERAEQVLRELLAEAERLALPRLLAVSRSTLGLVRGHLGAFGEAEALERVALTEAQAEGDPSMMGRCHQYLCMIRLLAGDPHGAEADALRALAVEDRSLRTVSLALLARALLEQARGAEALTVASQARDVLNRGGVVDREGLVRLAWCEALHASGDERGARAAIQEAEARLRARADKIADPALRSSFLRHVPEHARTFALAQAWRSA
jgi:hypothetical protein